MPNYEYRCPSCGYTIEKIHPVDQTIDIPCPTCGESCERQMGNIAVVQGFFRWYDVNKTKQDPIVFYPDGHHRKKPYNELYADGGL